MAQPLLFAQDGRTFLEIIDRRQVLTLRTAIGPIRWCRG